MNLFRWDVVVLISMLGVAQCRLRGDTNTLGRILQTSGQACVDSIQDDDSCPSDAQGPKPLCTPFRSPESCPREISFSRLVLERTNFLRTNTIDHDGWWFHHLEDKVSGYAFAIANKIASPQMYHCGELAHDVIANLPATSFVIRGLGLHSSRGVYVFPKGLDGGVELMRGLSMSLEDILADLKTIKQFSNKVIIEQFVAGPEGQLPMEFKFHVFNGKVSAINVIVNRGTPCGCWLEIDESFGRLDQYGCFTPSSGAYEEPYQDGLCYPINFLEGSLRPHPMKGFDLCSEVPVVDPCVWEHMLTVARQASNLIGAYIRIDMFLGADGQAYLQEFSTNHMNGLRHCTAVLSEDGCIDACYLGKEWGNAGGNMTLGGPLKPLPSTMFKNFLSLPTDDDKCQAAMGYSAVLPAAFLSCDLPESPMLALDSVIFTNITNGTIIDTSGEGLATGSFILRGVAPPGTKNITLQVASDGANGVFEEAVAGIVNSKENETNWEIEVNVLRSGTTTFVATASGSFSFRSATLTITLVAPSPNEALLRPTFVFTPQNYDRLLSYNKTAGTLVFSSDITADLRLGQGLASGPVDLAPDGYLRIVTGVKYENSTGITIVTTRQAGLAEFIRKASISYRSEQSQVANSTSFELGGARRRRSLLQLGPSTNLNFNLNFDPSASIDIDISWDKGDFWFILPEPILERFFFEIGFEFTGSVALEHTFLQLISFPPTDFGPDIEGTFGRIIIPTPFVVPIVVTLEFESVLQFSFDLEAQLVVAYNPTLGFKAGYEYLADGTGRGAYTLDTSSAREVNIDLSGKASLTVQAKVEVQALLYGAAGIEVECSPGLVFEAVADLADRECNWNVGLVVPFNAGVEVEIELGPFEREVEFKVDLFTISLTLLSGTVQKSSAEPTSTPAPTMQPIPPENKICGATSDPHFSSWTSRFSYQGACDLVFVRNDLVEVQIRTKLGSNRHFSFISNVAIFIGGDVLEVFSNTTYYVNGIEQLGGPPAAIGGPFPLSVGPDIHISLSGGQEIRVRFYRETITLEIAGHISDFGDSVGFMGSYSEQKFLGRDRTDVFSMSSISQNASTFANEWAVSESKGDVSLFVEPAEFEGCVEASGFSIDPSIQRMAEEACAFLPNDGTRENCIFDIMATDGAIEWAENPGFTDPIQLPNTQCFDGAMNECANLGGECRWRCDDKDFVCLPDSCEAASSLIVFDNTTTRRNLAVADGCSCALPLPSRGLISGNVKEDLDHDRVGDTAVASVRITLVRVSNSFTSLGTTLTDSGGEYRFFDVPAGTYAILLTNLEGYILVSDSEEATDNAITVTLGDGDESTGNMFVIAQASSAPSPSIVPPLGLISGSAREDSDNDGVGDSNLPNVLINLVGVLEGAIFSTTLTDSEGDYAFLDVPAGRYVILLTNLAGYVSLSDSDGSITNSIVVTLGDGDESTGNMFVVAQASSAPSPSIIPPLGLISGSAREDSDNDGVGDSNLPNVLINLVGILEGAIFSTTLTDSEGDYAFLDVPAGRYVILLTNLAGYVSASDSDGSITNSIVVTLGDGDESTGNMFVIAQASSAPSPSIVPPLGLISGSAREDSDDDGIGDSNLPNVLINLVGVLEGAIFSTTLTDSEGNYAFLDVPAGRYVILLTDLAGYVSASDTDGSVTPSIVVTLGDGDESTGNMFVVAQASSAPSPSIVPPLGLISGSAREDIDNDGIGDLILSNLNITIFGFGSLDSSPTTLTDSEGNYAFFDVPAPGTYVIVPTNLIGFGGASNTSIIVTLADGDVSTGNMLILPPLGSISGSAKEDTDNDGVGDTNLANVFILLAGYDVTFFGVTRTDSEGNYSFNDVPAGEYGIFLTNAEDLSGITGDDDALIKDTINITLGDGDASTGNAFVDIP